MKQYIVVIAICLSVFLVLAGCNINRSENMELPTGFYFENGAYWEAETPYLHLDFEENSLCFGKSMITSYAESGSFKVKDGKIMAECQSATFIFEIINSKTVMLVDSGVSELFRDLEGAKFIYHKE